MSITKEDLGKEVSGVKEEIKRIKKKLNKSNTPVKHLYEYILFNLQLELSFLEKLNKRYFEN